MAEIVMCGGSVVGLTAAMLLANDGHHVTVLEADGAAPPSSPEAAWEGWGRTGVAQFHQPHNLFPRFRQIADAELPGLTQRLEQAGGRWMNPLAGLPPSIADREPRPDDDRFRFVTGRRPVVEAVVAATAAEHDGVTIRRGAAAAGVLTGDPVAAGAPHVTGVVTGGGEEVRADLVIDAMGRRSKMAEWLAAVGGPALPTESEDSGFVYYTQYFKGTDLPTARAGALSALGSISMLTLAADNDTWSVTVFAASNDKAAKAMKDPAILARVVAAHPLHAQWLEGEAIGGVEVMGGILDKLRNYVVDGRPIATGVLPVGDAWACTNPSAGRGISVGTVHAQRLRDATRDAPISDPVALARRFGEQTERDVLPFFRNQIAFDRFRVAEMTAHREGTDPPSQDPLAAAIAAAAVRDPDVFRGVVETLTCLAFPHDVFARPGMAEKIASAAAAGPPPVLPRPTRAELEELLAS